SWIVHSRHPCEAISNAMSDGAFAYVECSDRAMKRTISGPSSTHGRNRAPRSPGLAAAAAASAELAGRLEPVPPATLLDPRISSILPAVAERILEPVAAGQTRFRMQGLAPDARGIAVGREALIVFESLDRLVSFLGAYSVEASLDDLLPTMTLERGHRTGGGTALLVRCEASDGYALDRLSRLAGAARSQLYAGSGSVFVRYRESRAPLGYDLAVPLAELLAREGNTAGL